MAIESSTVPEKTPMPWGLYVVGALGGLLFGFDTGVISGAGPLVQNDWGLNAAQLGFITASVLIGSMIGALSVGRCLINSVVRNCLLSQQLSSSSAVSA